MICTLFLAAGLQVANIGGCLTETPDNKQAGYVAFCREHVKLCRPEGTEVVVLTAERKKELATVNHEVNRAISYRADAGRDQWTVLAKGGQGDCEDYAVTKLAELVRLGWPRSALRLLVGVIPEGQHAVLAVQTDQGTLVLDNRTDVLKGLYGTGTIWFAAERLTGDKFVLSFVRG